MGDLAYRAFGLTVRSEIPLEGLGPAEPGATPDVVIVHTALGSACPSEPGLHPCENGTLLSIPEVGRYLCTGGRRIAVEPDLHAPQENVRLFLLGSAMGLILHQRGLLPLHANALEVGREAIAFMGRSGAGKSTLTAWYAEQGHRVIADDVTVVGFGAEGHPSVQPGLARIRLWRQTLESLGGNPDDHPRSFQGKAEYDKFDVALHHGGMSEVSLPLRAVCLLEFGPELAIVRLHGLDALDAVYANTYRGAFVGVTGTAQLHWESCIALIKTVPVFRTVRPESLPQLGSHARSMIAAVLEASEGGPS